MTATEMGEGTVVECDGPKPLRKDAARNRALLLEAAHEVFAERGLEASLDDIARHAGVGVGTAYRHFANKQELVGALFAKHVDDLIARAEEALAIEDPWEAISTFFWTAAESQARDIGLHEVLVGRYPTMHPGNIRERLTGPITELFERAQKAGVLREGIVSSDSGVCFAVMGTLFTMSSATGTDIWRRYLAIALDGLRATDRGPLPTGPLTLDELDVAMKVVKHPKGNA